MEQLPANMNPEWNQLYSHLLDAIDIIEKDEPRVTVFARKGLLHARDMLLKLQAHVDTYQFKDSEEILFYKVVKPRFIAQVGFFSKLYKIESCRPHSGPSELIDYYKSEMKQINEIYQQHRFIHQYLAANETYLDKSLFFHPGPNNIFALYGFEAPVDGALPVCYDYVAGSLIAADLINNYLSKVIEDLTTLSPGAGRLPKLIWTLPKAHLIELGYALYAAKAFNNGKAPLKEIFTCLEAFFNKKIDNYPRTLQEILYRKSGYTVFLDDMRNALLMYIQQIEDKHIG
jgi:hypothetical protein